MVNAHAYMAWAFYSYMCATVFGDTSISVYEVISPRLFIVSSQQPDLLSIITIKTTKNQQK